jgi:hypothetical protein
VLRILSAEGFAGALIMQITDFEGDAKAEGGVSYYLGPGRKARISFGTSGSPLQARGTDSDAKAYQDRPQKLSPLVFWMASQTKPAHAYLSISAGL